jgi:hypothetical protein
MIDLLRDLRTAAIWTAFAAGIVFATWPLWSYLAFGLDLTLDDALLLRCFGLPS